MGSGTLANWIASKLADDVTNNIAPRHPEVAERLEIDINGNPIPTQPPIRGVMGDGSNMRGRPPPVGRTGMPTPVGGPWPGLKGKPKDEAVSYLKENFPELQIMAVPEGAMVTMDVRGDRVRVYFNEEGIVSKTPMIH